MKKYYFPLLVTTMYVAYPSAPISTELFKSECSPLEKEARYCNEQDEDEQAEIDFLDYLNSLEREFKLLHSTVTQDINFNIDAFKERGPAFLVPRTRKKASMFHPEFLEYIVGNEETETLEKAIKILKTIYLEQYHAYHKELESFFKENNGLYKNNFEKFEEIEKITDEKIEITTLRMVDLETLATLHTELIQRPRSIASKNSLTSLPNSPCSETTASSLSSSRLSATPSSLYTGRQSSLRSTPPCGIKRVSFSPNHPTIKPFKTSLPELAVMHGSIPKESHTLKNIKEEQRNRPGTIKSQLKAALEARNTHAFEQITFRTTDHEEDIPLKDCLYTAHGFRPIDAPHAMIGSSSSVRVSPLS